MDVYRITKIVKSSYVVFTPGMACCFGGLYIVDMQRVSHGAWQIDIDPDLGVELHRADREGFKPARTPSLILNLARTCLLMHSGRPAPFIPSNCGVRQMRTFIQAAIIGSAIVLAARSGAAQSSVAMPVVEDSKTEASACVKCTNQPCPEGYRYENDGSSIGCHSGCPAECGSCTDGTY